MKFKIILCSLVFLSLQALSQSKNNVSLVYGVAGNNVDIHHMVGDFGYLPQNGSIYGLSYSRNITRHLSIETGVLFSSNKVSQSVIEGGRGEFFFIGEVKMLTVPVYAKFIFLKYLFVKGGVLLDHQTNYSQNSVVNDQSGIGGEIGFGGQYSFGPVRLFVNPFTTIHAVVTSGQRDFNLMEKGAKFGLGYNF